MPDVEALKAMLADAEALRKHTAAFYYRHGRNVDLSEVISHLASAHELLDGFRPEPRPVDNSGVAGTKFPPPDWDWYGAPLSGPPYPSRSTPTDAMSLRDQLAGQAMAGLLAFSPHKMRLQLEYEEAARDAYAFADAMIAHRTKPAPQG